MRILFKILLIACMAFYSYNLHSEVVKVKKGIQPVSPKDPKKSKSSQQEEPVKETECKKEKALCQK